MALSVRARSRVRDRGPAQRALEGAQGHSLLGSWVFGRGAGFWVFPLQVAASCIWQNYGNHCRNGPQGTKSGSPQRGDLRSPPRRSSQLWVLGKLIGLGPRL